MGAYLSEPITEKCSSDETNDFIEVGASSMQGWRISQEDAHNCILSFDDNTSLFAVYDGHGGAEVATYTAEMFPDFLKKLQIYKDGDFEQALKDSFLGFDATLLEEDVIVTLKKLAGEKNPDECSEMEEEEEEDLMELCQEGTLPLDQVLEKYKGCVQKIPYLNKLKFNEPDVSASGSGTEKPLSPFLRGRQSDPLLAHEPATPSSSTSKESAAEKSSTRGSAKRKLEPDADDSTVSSSSGNIENNPHTQNSSEGGEGDSCKTNEASSSNERNGAILKCSSPDSSSATSLKIPTSNVGACSPSSESKTKVRNGDVIGSASSSASSSSSTLHQEDEITTNSPIKAAETKIESVACSSSTSTVSSNAFSETPSRSSKQENGEVSSYSSEVTKDKDADESKVESQTNSQVVSSDSSASPNKISSSTNEEKKSNKQLVVEEDDSSSDDTDFQAGEDENSSTEDGDADCESCDDEETEDEEEETIDPEDAEDAEDPENLYTNMIEEPGKDSGCTAVVALINGRDLYVANAGDSRCVVCRNGKAVDMSIDHKPEDKEESERIVKAGGNVTIDGRVNGGLNLSRAIGDHAYKMNKDLPPEKQMISAMPDVRKLIILPEDEFMVIACDGIWNFMSSDEVVEFVKKRIDEGREKMSQICEELFTNCLAPNTIGDGTGCDNMTAVIVRFKPRILELSSKISVESEAIPVVPSKKRAASPLPDDDGDSTDAIAENSNKRQKTDDDSSDQVSTADRSSENDTSNGGDVPMPSSTDSNSIHQSTMATTS